MKEKLLKFWGLLGWFAPFVIVIIIQTIMTIIIGFIEGIKYAVNNTNITQIDLENWSNGLATNPEFLLKVTMISGIICFIVFGIWYRVLRNNEEKKEKVIVKPMDFLIIAVIGICAQFAISFVLTLISMLFPAVMESYSQHMDNLMVKNSIISIITVVIVAPIYEEFVFRGVTMVKAHRMSRFMIANVFQAVLFGVIHMQLVQGIYAFCLGLILGYIWKKYNNIWLAVFLHFVVNGSGALLDALVSDSMGKIADLIFMILSGLSVVLLVFMILRLKKREVTVIPLEVEEDFMDTMNL